jgi:hypothetical protein
LVTTLDGTKLENIPPIITPITRYSSSRNMFCNNYLVFVGKYSKFCQFFYKIISNTQLNKRAVDKVQFSLITYLL